MIKCNECGHDNEIQRVYCHNCGARLDRAALVEEAQKPQKVVKPKRVSSGAGGLGKFVGNLVKTLLLAAIVASLLEACRTPDGVPSSEKSLGGDIIDAPSVSMDLETAAGAPTRIAYSAAQLNAYLKNRIKAPKIRRFPPGQSPSIPLISISKKTPFASRKSGSSSISPFTLAALTFLSSPPRASP